MYKSEIKTVTIIGARPQFVKHAIFQRYLNGKGSRINNICIHTGQHFDSNMTSEICRDFDIANPDISIESKNIDKRYFTSELTSKLTKILSELMPEFVVLYGDTNSTLAGALAANSLSLKIIHVEAGLRSFDMRMPEERNRVITDRLSRFLIVPDDGAAKNLTNEGFPHGVPVGNDLIKQKVLNFGDVMLDGFLMLKDKYQNMLVPFDDFVLLTLHREQLYRDDEYFDNILGLVEILAKYENIIFPSHPRIYKNKEIRTKFETIGVKVIAPLTYLEMQSYLACCKYVVTDSGGLQKEAYFHEKQCITLRDSTEWTATLENKCNQLVADSLVKFTKALKLVRSRMHSAEYPLFKKLYGSGNFCTQLENLLLDE